jgi:hypothetical protein
MHGMQRVIVPIVVVALVVGGGIALADASSGSPDARPSVSATAEAPAAPEPATARHRHHRRRHAVRVLRLTAETIGIEPKELREQLRAGKTVADVATANGVEPQAVVDAIVAKATERITARAEHFVHETGTPRD